MNYLQEIKHRVIEFWQSRNRAQKIKLAVFAAIIVIALGAMLYIINRPVYVPLYTNLDVKDAAEIAEKLEENNIAYKLEDQGETILVNPEQKYKVRLMLAQEGLPKGGSMGFDDVFSQSRLGTTEWERRIQYNQALQGELARAIEMMKSVERAKVYIVQQEDSLFIEPNSNYEPSAAVFLQLKTGHEMTKEEIMGIINLITYSVKNMKPENVTVVDQYGRTLSNIPLGQEEDTHGAINNQLTIQSNFQNQLQANVQTLLEQIFGTGNVAVRVNAELNFDKKTVQSKLFTPVNEETGEGIVRSIQELKEYFNGTGAPAGGVPGVDANVPGYQQANIGTTEQQRTEVIKNYDINETYETLTVAPGAVNRLSVSVVINRSLTDGEKESIALLVGNAIGYNPDRDQITVEGMEFQNDMAKLLAGELERQRSEQQRMRNMILVGIGLVALVAFIAIRTVMSRKRRIREEEKLAQEMLAMQQAAAAKIEEEPPLEIRDSDIFQKIEKHARRNPEDVAKVIKTWLMED